MTFRTGRLGRLVPLVLPCLVGLAAPAMRAEELPVKPILDPARQAITAIKDKDFKAARLAIRLVSDPFEKDALLFRLYRRGGNDATSIEIIEFVGKHRHWPLQASLRQSAEGAHLGKTTDEQLIDWFQKNPPSTRIGCTRHIERLLNRGDGPAADDEIVRCWKTLALSTDGAAKFLKRYGDKLSQRDKAARIDRLLDRRRHRLAEQLLSLVDLPERRARPLKIRIALQRRPRGTEIPKLLRDIAKLPANVRQDPDFLLDFARWNRRRRDNRSALKALAAAPKPVRNAPGRWWLERSIAIRRYMEAGNLAVAYRLAADHRQAGGYLYAGAETLAGWIALRKRRQTKQASVHFKRVFDRADRNDVRARGAYWLARAAEARRDSLKATAWLKSAAVNVTDIFGQLAAVRLQSKLLRLPAETVIPAADRKAFDAEPAVRLAILFTEKGDAAEGRRLLWWLLTQTLRSVDAAGADGTANAGRRLLMVAELAERLGANDIALRAARIALRHGEIRMAIAFPAPALPKGLPVERALVLAIARQESEFNINAQSSAGAQGLMQLLPSTAKLMAKRAKLPWTPEKLTGDADYNYRLGAAYLSHLLARFDRSYLLAAAAYNAGPTRVKRWIRKFGLPGRRISPVDWIESIPFGETRNYVRRVLANVQVYRARLGGGALLPTPDQLWRSPKEKDACRISGDCKKRI